MMPKKPWKKVLYGNEEYPDNYTDESFWKDLKTNLNLKTYKLLEIISGLTRLSQEISFVALFLVIFYYLSINELQPQKLLFNSFVVTGFGYFCYVGKNLSSQAVIEDSKTVLAVFLFTYLFSPLLQTLTDEISSDSIFTLTFVSLFLHLLLHDYGVDGFLVSKAISLNAAIFASICLASRLSSPLHAFVLLVISAQFFALKPLLFEKRWHPLALLPIILVTSYILFTISKIFLVIYLLILVFVNLICPLVFYNMQKNKNTIFGPWDEAILTVSE